MPFTRCVSYFPPGMNHVALIPRDTRRSRIRRDAIAPNSPRDSGVGLVMPRRASSADVEQIHTALPRCAGINRLNMRLALLKEIVAVGCDASFVTVITAPELRMPRLLFAPSPFRMCRLVK